MFVTGATGYLGRPLTASLLANGHRVTALARANSRERVTPGCSIVTGDALNAASYRDAIAPADTFVHLIGTPHPSPKKAAEFQAVDLTSIRAAVAAVTQSTVRHFIYVSVAQPAPIMRAYIAVRAEGESLIRSSGLPATMLRPWYVLGPGHRWPYALIPLYWLLGRAGVEGATRLGLVTRRQMIDALVRAVEQPAEGTRIWGVTEIRNKPSRRPPA